ncbi:MAG: type II secretion system F family protein [Nanoarchaeota archaeon]|nr:type II secretion system F family protein [Nanoarchaeota archaeon]
MAILNQSKKKDKPAIAKPPAREKDDYAQLKAMSVKFFGRWADKYSASFESVRKPLSKSGMKTLFRTYVSLIFFLPLLGFFISFLAALFISVAIVGIDILMSVLYSAAASAVVAAIVFAMVYLYPISVANARKRSIDANMPFAINHMAAIAGSGVPPSTMFKLLTSFGEYGELSKESEKIVRNIELFGLDVVTSMKEVAKRTPSSVFKELLDGMTMIIEVGGNLQLFLKTQSDKSLFEYRIKREKYLEVLSTYADFYTAVLIMAPMFLIAILAIMNMIGGDMWGMPITGSGDIFDGTYKLGVMDLGIYLLIPVVNIAFIIFVHLTQPEL